MLNLSNVSIDLLWSRTGHAPGFNSAKAGASMATEAIKVLNILFAVLVFF